MENSSAIFWMLMLFAVAVAMPSDLRQRLSKREMNQQNKELTEALINFPCETPQERFITLDELVPNRVTSEVYSPPGVVLHRCDQESGWCWNNDCKCGPLKNAIVNVTLVFYVKNIFGSKGNYRIIHAQNHTKCGCLKLKDTEMRKHP